MDAGGSAPSRLRSLTAIALEARSSGAVIDAFVEAVRDLLAVDQVHVIEVSQDAAVGHARVASFDSAEPESDVYVQVLDERPSGVAQVVASGDVLHVPDAHRPGLIRDDYAARFDVESALFVPISWNGDVRHVVVNVSHTPRAFTAEEIELARMAADIAGLGLALWETAERERTRKDRDAALARAARALTASLDLQTVLETLAAEADQALAGDIAGVYLGDGERGGVASAGHNVPPDWLGYVMKPGEGVAGRVLATGSPAISNAYQSDVRLPENPSLRRVQTAVAVPMSWGGELKGALSIGFMRMRRITESDLRTLEAIADLATVACRNAEAFATLEAAARLDALTGLLDHGSLQSRVQAEVERARQGGTGLAYMVVDLDRFGEINRRAGHREGDDVLCRVADVLREQCAEEGLIGRFGGDQFAVAVPGVGLEHAVGRAESMRAALGDRIRLPGGDRLDCSVGVAAWDGSEDAGALVDRTLACVRAAKQSGGGRVSAAPPAPDARA